MQILGLSGSLRRDSHNTRLLAGTRKLLPSGIELLIFDQLGAVPAFNEDDEHLDPPAVAALRAAVAGLQGLRKRDEVARSRGREVHQVAPKPMVDAIAAAEERTSAARAAALQEQYGVTDPSPGGTR